MFEVYCLYLVAAVVTEQMKNSNAFNDRLIFNFLVTVLSVIMSSTSVILFELPSFV